MESRFVSADERWPDVLEVKECEEEKFAVFHHHFARRYERCPAQTSLLSLIVFLRQMNSSAIDYTIVAHSWWIVH